MINLNEQKLSLKTALPLIKEHANLYKSFLDLGIDSLSKKRIAVSILARNNSDVIQKNLTILINALKKAKDYRIIIYENDSEDNTVELIKDLAKDNDRILLHTKKHNRKHYGPVRNVERTINLAEYRNHNLSVIAKNFADFDYTIVCDIDFLEFYDVSIYHSLGVIQQPNVNAVCGVSYTIKQYGDQQILWNYDSWAYRGSWWQDLNLIPGLSYHMFKDAMAWYGIFIPPMGSQPFQVNSAFGGMAIYKTCEYIQGLYKGGDCEHVNFHLSLSNKNPKFMLLLNPSQVMLMKE